MTVRDERLGTYDRPRMGGGLAPGLDPISMIEAAYRAEVSDEAWLAGLIASAAPLDPGIGRVAFTFEFGADGSPRVLAAQAEAKMSEWFPQFRDTIAKAPPHMVAEYLGRSVCTTSSMLSNHAAASASYPPGVRDALGIVARDTTEAGVCLSVFLPEPTRFPRRTTALWLRVAAHIAAGMRIRRFLRASGADAPPEAILTSTGRVEHAVGESTSRRARSILREGVMRIDRARSRLRRSSPEQAVELWQGLLAGRWSLVDHFESDGRRYVLARRNDPAAQGAPALSLRERQVLGYAALGHSNKLIGYELGLSASTIATHLGAGMRKLGLRSRVELVALGKRLLP